MCFSLAMDSDMTTPEIKQPIDVEEVKIVRDGGDVLGRGGGGGGWMHSGVYICTSIHKLCFFFNYVENAFL